MKKLVASSFILFLSFQLISQNLLRSQVEVYTSMTRAKSEPLSVVHLDLSRQKIKTLPEEIIEFKNLRYLDVSNNRIEELPDFIFSLPKLEELDATSNKLYDLPFSIENAKKLKILKAGNNPIQSIPYTINGALNLEQLNLVHTEIKIFPKELSALTYLIMLELRGVDVSEEQQEVLKGYFPNAKIYFTNGCHCGPF